MISDSRTNYASIASAELIHSQVIRRNRSLFDGRTNKAEGEALRVQHLSVEPEGATGQSTGMYGGE
jgi:hypothetical protein